jgi:hypothetical protein
MDALITAIVLWLSANFGLPAIQEHPHIKLVPATEIVALRYKGLGSRQLLSAAAPVRSTQREVVSVYSDALRTIYLRDDWTGSTPAELSVLVHEIVHHLQNLGQVKFQCPQEREQLAYLAQERWLNLFAGSLERDFEIDPLTLLLSTKCGY